jgi:GNAT superfamily N-acetyltransferase
VNGENLRLERLDERHELAGFASDKDELDGWLHRYALAAQNMDSVRTFVVVAGERVAGYFSLTMCSVLRQEAPARLVRGLPGYPIGAVLLARLAVNQLDQGRGLGALLLAEAPRKGVAAGEHAAARLVVVDAIDGEAAEFYRRHGFVAAPEQALRLYRRIMDIRASFDAPPGTGRST